MVATASGSGSGSSTKKVIKTALRNAMKGTTSNLSFPLSSVFVFAAVGASHDAEEVVACLDEQLGESLIGVHCAPCRGYISGPTGAKVGRASRSTVSLFLYLAKWEPSSRGAQKGIPLDFSVAPALIRDAAEKGAVEAALLEACRARGPNGRDPDVILVSGGTPGSARKVATIATQVVPQVPLFGWSGTPDGGKGGAIARRDPEGGEGDVMASLASVGPSGGRRSSGGGGGGRGGAMDSCVISDQDADDGAIVIAALWTPGPLVFSAASGFAASPFAGIITRVDGATVVEIDRQPAADVVLRWLFGTKGNHDPSELVRLSTGIPLGIHVRFDDEGDEQFDQLQIVNVDPDDKSIVLSAPVERGARVTFSHGSAADVIAALHRKSKDMLKREFMAPILAQEALVGLLSVIPSSHFLGHHDDQDEVPDADLSASKLEALDTLVDNACSSAWILADGQTGTYATGESGAGTLFSPSMYVIRGSAASHHGVSGVVQPGSGNIVYTDIQDSTVLWLSDEEVMSKALAVHDATIRKVIAKFRGTELKTQGDAFLIFFRTLHDSVRFCVQVQTALLNAKWPEEIFDHASASIVKRGGGGGGGGSDDDDDDDDFDDGGRKNRKKKRAKDKDKGGSKYVYRGLRVRMGLHHVADELVYSFNTRAGVLEPVGPVVAAGSTVADCGAGGQTLLAAQVAPKVAMGVKRSLLPAIELQPAGNVMTAGVNIGCVTLVAGPARFRKFGPLRTRTGVGHWTQVGRNVAMDRAGLTSRAGGSISSLASSGFGVVGPAQGTGGDDLVVYREGRDDFHIVSAGVAGERNTLKAVAKIVSKLRASLKFSGFSTPPHALFVYFTDNMDAKEVLSGLRGYAPHAAIIGCTSAYAAVTEDGWHGTPGVDGPSLGVMAIHDEQGTYIASRIEIDPENPLESARALGDQIKERCADSAEGLPVAQWMMAPAGNEEDLLRGLLASLGENLVLAGGSSGVVTLDDPGHQITGDPESGDVVTKNALTLLSMYPSCSVQLRFGHGYRPTPKVGVVTRAEGRVILEIDGRPAADVYNEWIGGEIDAWLDGEKPEDDTLIFANCARLALGREVAYDNDGDPVYALSHAVAIVPDEGEKSSEDGEESSSGSTSREKKKKGKGKGKGKGKERKGASVSAKGISWITEFREGDRVRLCVATDHARANRMSVMLRQHMQSPVMRACDVHGHVIAACVSLPMTIGERMAEYSTGFAAALEHTPCLLGWTYGEQGTFSNGRLQHSNIMLSAMSFVSAKASGVEAVLEGGQSAHDGTAHVPTGFVAILFLAVDDLDALTRKRPAVGKRAMSAVLALAESELDRMHSPGYLVKSDKLAGTVMIAFSSIDAAVDFACSYQKAAMGVKWPEEMLKSKKFALVKNEDSGKALFRGPRIRMGLNAGEPVIRFNLAGHIDYFGTVVNLASRLTSHAPPGTWAAPASVAESVFERNSKSGSLVSKEVDGVVVRGIAHPVDILVGTPTGFEPRLDGKAKETTSAAPSKDGSGVGIGPPRGKSKLPALPQGRSPSRGPSRRPSGGGSPTRSKTPSSSSSRRGGGQRRRSSVKGSPSRSSGGGGSSGTPRNRTRKRGGAQR